MVPTLRPYRPQDLGQILDLWQAAAVTTAAAILNVRISKCLLVPRPTSADARRHASNPRAPLGKGQWGEPRRDLSVTPLALQR